MKLIDTLKIKLSKSEEQSILRIDSEDFNLVRQKATKQLHLEGVEIDDDYIDRGILALKQYYAVAVLDPQNPHAVSDLVDPFWHAHILDTFKYAKFCDETSGYFMHHKPHDSENSDQIKMLGETYLYTMSIYDQIFNHFDDDFTPSFLPEGNRICFHFNDTTPSNIKRFPTWKRGSDIKKVLEAV